MSHRTLIAAAALVATASLTPAQAAARLSGTYIGTMTQLCQAIGSSSAVPWQSGDLEQNVGLYVFAGGKLTIKGVDFWGPSIDHTPSIRQKSVSVTMTVTMTGSDNPYQVTAGGLKNIAYLGQVDAAGVAHHAVMIGSFSSNSQTAPNCSAKIILDLK